MPTWGTGPRRSGRPAGGASAFRPWGLAAAVTALLTGADCRREGPSPLGLRARASGSEVHWNVDEVVLEPVSPPGDSGVTSEELVEALTAESAGWNEALTGCSAVPRLRVGAVRPSGSARTDGHNVVVVLASSWCPADRRPIDPCYSPNDQATTAVRTGNGGQEVDAGRSEVVEADIEVNAVNFHWSLDGEVLGTRSLRAVLGHELGHVLGLAHACSPHPSASDVGNIPNCRSPGLSESIMYPNPTESGRPLVLTPDPTSVAVLCGPHSWSGCLRRSVESP